MRRAAVFVDGPGEASRVPFGPTRKIKQSQYDVLLLGWLPTCPEPFAWAAAQVLCDAQGLSRPQISRAERGVRQSGAVTVTPSLSAIFGDEGLGMKLE